MKSYTKEQLIEASKKYHKDVLKNPDNYIENDLSEDTSVEFINYLIDLIE